MSEIDIENIMRAKAAIYAASSLLLEGIGISHNDIARFYIAGGFGKTLNIENAVAIGLLRTRRATGSRIWEHLSRAASYRLLVSEKHRSLQRDLAKRMTYVDPGADPRYMDHYTAALFLPHTDGSLFPAVKRRAARHRA